VSGQAASRFTARRFSAAAFGSASQAPTMSSRVRSGAVPARPRPVDDSPVDNSERAAALRPSACDNGLRQENIQPTDGTETCLATCVAAGAVRVHASIVSTRAPVPGPSRILAAARFGCALSAVTTN
jgi:hypothetical protein